MAVGVTWEGYDALILALGGLADPPMGPLMETWERIIVEGNRRGVLSGLDGNNQSMPPLTYRNGGGVRARNRGSRAFGTRKHRPQGFGPRKGFFSTTGGNLTTREYQELTGPRLAPRGERSRVITNLETAHGRDPAKNYGWFAEGAWFDVESVRGFKFLVVHFEGLQCRGFRMPRYDLRPVRPEDRALAVEALEDFMQDLLKRLFA